MQQTDDIDSNSAKIHGFGNAEEPSSRGNYTYQFTEEGVFYYWSGSVNPSGELISTIMSYVGEPR